MGIQRLGKHKRLLRNCDFRIRTENMDCVCTWVKDSGNGKRISQEEVKRVNKNRGGRYGLV